MGAVFEGLDEELGRRVAIKVLTPRKDEDSQVRLNDLLAEARALARINHPNVVQIHSVGQHKDQPYIVMELVGGGPRLEDYSAGRATLDEREALELLVGIAQGLAVAARAHLVHGDIKPQNILVSAERVAKVVDFGLTDKARQTGGTTVWGTPYYIAPERARGGACDTRGDIFSLGATMWHMLAGRPPYEGKTVREVVSARLRGEAPDIRTVRPEIHPPTATLLARMMASDPAQRPGSFERVATEAAAALKAVEQDATDALTALAESSGEVSVSPPPRFIPPQPAARQVASAAAAPRGRRKSIWVLAFATGALATAVIGGIFLLRHAPGSPTDIISRSGGRGAGESFEGWALIGATSAGAGGLAITATAGSAGADPPEAARDLLPGSFAATLEFTPLTWSQDFNQKLQVAIVDGAARLTIEIEKPGVDYPTLRILSRTEGASDDPQPVHTYKLPFDPASLTLWIGWAEAERQWTVAIGLDGAAPRPLASTTWAAASSDQRQLRVTAAASGTGGTGGGRFTATLAHFQLQRGTPLPPR